MSDNMKELISIIVPFYNVESYLRQCLDSLVSQSYSNIEILLIDDGSTDKSGNIADEYAQRDNRIRAFHQPNGGISAARNKGLDVMSGDYVMFVDGDDYVDKDYCKVALNLAIEKHVDIVSFGYCLFIEQNGFIERNATRNPRLLNKEEAILELIRRREVMNNFVWNKIFKSQLFRDVKFPEGQTFEDVAIMHLLFDQVTCVYLSDKVLYYYRRERRGSITTSYKFKSSKAIHDRLIGELQRLDFIKEHYPALEIKQYSPLLGVCFQGLTLLPFGHKDRKLIKNFLNSNKAKCLSASFGKRRKRLKAYYYMKPLYYLASYYVKRHYYSPKTTRQE